MLNKKKTSTTKKKVTQKKKIYKISDLNGETIATTKQKTYATIQQTNQPIEHKISTRTTHFCSKRQYMDQMQAHKLSPFSSPGKSISPRCRNSLSPIVVKQQSRRKGKKNAISEKVIECKKLPNKSKKQKKTSKEKNSKMRNAKTEFHNEFLKRMSKIQSVDPKKITELSQQSIQGSNGKLQRPLQLKIPFKKSQFTFQRRKKVDVFKEMHSKIKIKYRKMYPKLEHKELKVLAAIILVQRIWRQKKVKDLIGDFLSPRAFNVSYEETIARNLKNYQKSIQSAEDPLIQNTMKTDHEMESFLEEKNNFKKNMLNISQKSELVCTTPIRKKDSCESIDLSSLELSDQLSECSSSKKEQRIISYVNMYREVTLMKKKEKIKKKKNKPNVFSIPESFSEKCLLDKLYRNSMKNIQKKQKISKQEVDKCENFIFPLKSCERSKEQYLSPKKPEIVELEERFYTEAQDEDFVQESNANKILSSEPLKPEQQTLGNIAITAEQVIKMLIEQFSQEFLSFSSKKCLKKKRRAPGISINKTTINQYLSQFIKFLSSNYVGHIDISFRKITPMSFLKIFRVFTDQDLFGIDSDIESEEDEFSWPILPTNAFFEYQPVYEENIFVINEEDRKYSNFLMGLIKIHNKCLIDCLSQYIQKTRVDSLIFPWDTHKTQQYLQARGPSSKQLDGIVSEILRVSQTRLGTLRSSSRYRDLDSEESNLLLSLREDYKKEGRQWDIYSESLEIRLELTEGILDELWRQVEEQLINLIR